MSLKKLAISIPLSLMAILFSSKVHAYAFTSDYNKGFYWKSFPITMKRFVTDSSDASNLQTLTDQAVQEWESAIGQNVWALENVVQSSSYSGNYIRWSSNFGSETGYDPNSTLAVTIRYNKGTFFEQVVIILNGNLSYLKQNSGNALKTTLLHEIGHTVGLDHTTVSGAIMYPTLGSTSTLQTDDIQGMSALISDTQHKQQTGYVSQYAASSDSKSVAACGTVEDISKNGSGPGGKAVMNFVGAILLGFLAAKMASRKSKQRVLVKF